MSSPSIPSTPQPIPPFDLGAEVEELRLDLEAALGRVLASGQFVLGPEVEALEAEIAAYLGVRHAVALNSGTDALLIALEAVGVGPGDEVITTPFSFFATAEAVSRLGATPVFADIAPESFNLDPAGLEGALSPRTKVVLPVHLFGLPADMDPLLAFAERHGLALVEDCAQSFGARALGRKTGSLGAAGAHSFYPTKNLGAYGDGGLLSTQDDALAETARRLRNHGSSARYVHTQLGYNSRLDALQAAVLRVKLPHVEAWNGARREAAARYDRLLADLPLLLRPRLAPGHVFHQYTVRILGSETSDGSGNGFGDSLRDSVREHLARRGVSSTVYYPVPLHRSPVYGERYGPLPEAERAAREVLSLPFWPTIALEQQERVAAALREALD